MSTSETPSIEHPRRSYVLLLIADLLWVFGITLYAGFTALYIQDLGATPVDVGVYYTILAFTSLIAIVVGGPLTNRFGEKTILVGSWFIILPAPLILLTASSWQWTLGSAVFEGISMIASAPLGSYISYLTGGKHKGLIYTIFGAASCAGNIPGPLLGGFLIDLYGYHLVYILATIVYFSSALFTLPISKVSRIPRVSTHPQNMGFLSNRVFLYATILFAINMGILNLAYSFLPLFLRDRFGFNTTQIGLLGSILNTSAAIFGPLLGAAADKFGFTGVITFKVFTSIGFFSLLVYAPSPIFLPAIYAIHGLSYRLNLILMAVFSRHLLTEQLPNAMAVFSASGRVLSPFTPLLGGIGYTIDPSIPLFYGGLLIFLPLIFVVLLYRAQKQNSPLETTNSSLSSS
jgi:MFS family permease